MLFDKKASSVSQALVYQRLRETEGKIMHKIDQYFMHHFSADALFAAWCEFQLWPEDEEALLPLDDAPEGEGMFAVWRQFSWLGADDLDTEGDETLVLTLSA